MSLFFLANILFRAMLFPPNSYLPLLGGQLSNELFKDVIGDALANFSHLVQHDDLVFDVCTECGFCQFDAFKPGARFGRQQLPQECLFLGVYGLFLFFSLLLLYHLSLHLFEHPSFYIFSVAHTVSRHAYYIKVPVSFAIP